MNEGDWVRLFGQLAHGSRRELPTPARQPELIAHAAAGEAGLVGALVAVGAFAAACELSLAESGASRGIRPGLHPEDECCQNEKRNDLHDSAQRRCGPFRMIEHNALRQHSIVARG